MSKKTHVTTLDINLGCVARNLTRVRKLSNGKGIISVVKAFGYGAGDLEIAKLMEQQGVEALGVAYADEGVALRRAGITLPIMVMNAEPAAFNGIIEYQLDPVIYNERILDSFIEFTWNSPKLGMTKSNYKQFFQHCKVKWKPKSLYGFLLYR